MTDLVTQRQNKKTMSKAINLLLTEPINCAKNPIFRFEMVAVVLCWNSVAVNSYFYLFRTRG